MKKISETEDYNVFLNSLENKISTWRADNKFPREQRISLGSTTGRAFYLWGDAGTGKTQYLNIFLENTKEKITEIHSLDEIKGNGNIYLFDAVNESKSFSEKELDKIVKNTEAFIIYAGWERSRIFYGHNINPSEELVLAKGWSKLEKYNVGHHFSIREKFLMTDIKNYEEIAKKEFHAVIWKSFENIMTIPEKNYYKSLVEKNPLYISWEEESNDLFKSLLAKKVIQYNDNRGEYIFSHQNMVNHLFFRDYADEIKKLSINDDFLLEVISKEPAQFINWWKVKKGEGNIGEFFVKNNISIRVIDHQIFDAELTLDKIKYRKLTFEDLCILEELKMEDRIYIEFLNNNISTNRELNSKNINKSDLVYFVYSIHSPIRGDDHYPSIMNSMRMTSFETRINWNNSNRRYQMLNYILGRYIHAYIDEDFSSLEASKLTNFIFSNWDKNNKLPFKKFVVKHHDEIVKFLNNDETLAWTMVERFDAVLNSGKGRWSILDASHRYNYFDDFFHCGRNAIGQRLEDCGHKYVNLSMYLLFERDVNDISLQEMELFYKQQYNGGPFHSGTEITDGFEKFMILLTKKYVYYYHNEPVYDREFDPNIETLPQHIQESFVENNIQEVYEGIRKYLKDNPNTLNISWEIDKMVAKNGLYYIWVRNYNRYSIYDPNPPKDAVFSAESVYDPSGTRFIIKGNQRIEVSKEKTFNKYIVSYKLDSKKERKILDAAFIIELDKAPKLEMIKYKDITSWNITDDEIIDKEYERADNIILPIIKKGYKK